MSTKAATTRLTAPSHSPSHFFVLLAAATMLLRAAVPVGFMVSASADGPVVTLCGDGLGQIVVFDPRMGAVPLGAQTDTDHDDGAATSAPCAFAAASNAALPEFDAFAIYFTPHLERIRAALPVFSLAALTSPAASPRGPPLFL